ncbi:MAG: Gfo/Idh/MocA family oxidoreductase [Anaerolineae bacterium]|nr:Gfo/Idh/MocA family oxidoreductase [Anaerolineae bacterium]
MRNIRVGVVGCGYWGPKLVRNFQSIPGADMYIVADLRQDRLDHIRGLYPGVRTTKDYRELLASPVEAVAVATPVSTHYQMAKEALLHNKHVLVEKPLTRDSREAEELIALAKERGRVLMVGHTFEYNPAVQYLKEYIAKGELGRVYYINCTRVNLGIFQQDINVIWDLAPHDVSILLYILGMKPTQVSARGAAYVQPNIEDVAYVTLYFPTGIMADIRVSWLDPCKIRRITVVGSKKMIVYDDVEPTEKIKIYDKGVDAPPYSDTLEEFRLSYRYGDITTPAISNAEPLELECRHFLECIREGRSPRSDGVVGLNVVKILEGANRSLKNGGLAEELSW